MKKLSIIVFSLFTFCNVSAQQRTQRISNVTINVIGNKNTQVAVDGTTYTLAAGTTAGKATITNLEPGMHTLVLTRTNNRRSNEVTTQFNLRRNFDMTINVTATGALELIETRKGAGSGTGTTVRSPMSDANFYTLSRNVRAQRTADTRYSYLANTFSTANTYLSSKQVADLMRQVSTSTEAQRLQLAKLSYRTVVDPNNFYQVINLFTNSTSRYDLEDYVYYYDEENNTGTGGTVGSDYPNPSGAGMSQSNFTTLYNTIRGQYPATTQVNAINNAFTTSGNYFTAYQAGQLIQLVSNEAYRMQLAKASYRSIVDPTNFYTVRDLLYTQAARNELDAWVSAGATGTGTGTVVRTAMSDIDYNNLYESINSQFLPFAQMNALTATFNNSSYYFTTAQVEKLIQLVSSETNRLTLAKAAYRNTVDRANYPNLYDLFTNTAYRNDLVAYTQAYRDQ